jgi:hypothetical protein
MLGLGHAAAMIRGVDPDPVSPGPMLPAAFAETMIHHLSS